MNPRAVLVEASASLDVSCSFCSCRTAFFADSDDKSFLRMMKSLVTKCGVDDVWATNPTAASALAYIFGGWHRPQVSSIISCTRCPVFSRVCVACCVPSACVLMRPGESAPASGPSGAGGDGGGSSSGCGAGSGDGGGGSGSMGGGTWGPAPGFVDKFPVSEVAALRTFAVEGMSWESEQAEIAGFHSFAHLAIRLGMRDVIPSVGRVLYTMYDCRSGASWIFEDAPRLRAIAGAPCPCA